MALIRCSSLVVTVVTLGSSTTCSATNDATVPHLRQQHLLPSRARASSSSRSSSSYHQTDLRSLQEQAESLADLNPFAYYDGVSSLWYGPDNYSEVVFGYADIVNKIPLTVDATIPIGSNSKLFTAVAIYQLQEKGLLDVNTDIAEYLNKSDFEAMGIDGVESYCPKLANATEDDPCVKITIKNLLSMSSGIYTTLNCVPMASDPLCLPLPYFLNPGSFAAFVATFILLPLQFLPGTQYMYANPNFILCTYFVEKFSGLTFQEYLEKNIFEPIGLNNTSYDHWNGALAYQPKRPVSYYKWYSNTTPFEMLALGSGYGEMELGAVSGTGGLLSTQTDIRHWYHTLFNRTTGGAPIFQNASSQLALLEPITPNPAANGSGYFFYFAQGVVVFCAKEGCPDDVDYVLYQGGTIFCNTANFLDYKTMAMSQLWTISYAMFTTAAELQAVATQQSGRIDELKIRWTNPAWKNLLNLTLYQLQSGKYIGSAVPLEEPADDAAPTSNNGSEEPAGAAPTSSGSAAFFGYHVGLAMTFALAWTMG